MNWLKKLGVTFSALLSASTVICGCSIAQEATVELSSLNFHIGLAILTILASFGTIALFARTTKKQ